MRSSGLVLFPACRDILIEEKVTNEQDILTSVMCFFPFECQLNHKNAHFSLLITPQGSGRTVLPKQKKNWVIPAPSTQRPKNQSKMQLQPPSACDFSAGGAIPPTSRAPQSNIFHTSRRTAVHKQDKEVQNTGHLAR